MLDIRRRQFISLLGGTAATWPLAARAQQAVKLPKIGFLGATTPAAQIQWTTAFAQRLRELGWMEGRNVAIEYRWAEGLVSATPRSRPSSSDSRLMLSSRTEPQLPSSQSSRESRAAGRQCDRPVDLDQPPLSGPGGMLVYGW